MDRYRGLHLVLLAATLSLILAVSISPAAAQGSAAGLVITPARIAELAAYARRHGRSGQAGSRLAAPLGVTQPNVSYPACQVVITRDGRRHVWQVHQSRTDFLVLAFTFVEQRNTEVWVLDLRGALVGAGAIREGNFQIIPTEQARASFDAEMRLWLSADLSPPNPPREQACGESAR